jgi:phosphoglycolate phosphatase-like HAD superfamily hydrolase
VYLRRRSGRRRLLVWSVIFRLLVASLVAGTFSLATALAAPVDPLQSWNESASKRAIIDFVERVTLTGSKDFVPVRERIAVFDNDGTLWPENPVPFQVAFMSYEITRQLPDHPEWKDDAAIRAFRTGDLAALTADDNRGLLRILALTHAGITTDEFARRVSGWRNNDRHPRFRRAYTDCVYQPMLELLAYLRAQGFETWIVSGGGKDFMRVWSEEVYGIPPQHIIGSYGQVKCEMRDGKPAAIWQFIYRRPIAAFGNSDGDQAMLQYITIGNPRPSFGLLVHHTDAEREYAYDAQPHSSGKLVGALAAARQRAGCCLGSPARHWEVPPVRTAI